MPHTKTRFTIDPRSSIAGVAINISDDQRVDTRILAEQLGLQHESVFKLVNIYKTSFDELGKVRFEIGPSSGSRTHQNERFALLNEDQCYLLLTFSRNTERVLQLKVRLVQAFKQVREQGVPANVEYLPTYHHLHGTVERLAANSSNKAFVHMNVNKAINNAVGIDSGMRASLDYPLKSLVTVAQMVALKAMNDAVDHHDGYANAKAALGTLQAVIRGPDKPKPKGGRKKLPKAA